MRRFPARLTEAVLTLLLLTSFATSCESNEEPNNTGNESSPKTEEAAPKSGSDAATTNEQSSTPAESLAVKDLLYAWVDKLNIRDAPNLKGKTVAEVHSNDALEFTGDKSSNSEIIVLRGVAYDEPWLKVITPSDKEGWVFGGAVKRKEDRKGNAPITDTKFDFPHFGSFDLSSWKNLGTKKEGDEVDYEITTYQKGGQLLEITKADMGEFYYGYTHKLMDANKKVLKERVVAFSIDPNNLEETVSDFTADPPAKFNRVQKIGKHYYQLNARPVMVDGTWTKSTLDEEAPLVTADSKLTFQSFDFSDCSKHVSKEFSCSCSFSTGDPYKGATIFVSGDDSGCFKVEDQLNALYSDWEDRDYKAELKKLAASKDWIMVKNSGITYFGKPLAFYKYENEVEFLTDVILASGKDIKAIPIQNTAEGMAVREVRDAAQDAITAAKAYRAKGGNDPLTILKMDNRRYDVFVRYRQVTQYEGEANEYEGKITLLPNRGDKILATEAIKGTCGC